jgi:transcriptional regulator with XRE-family HTH domain
MADSNKEYPHVDFARRLSQAVDNIPNIPPQHYGRLNFLEERFKVAGIQTSKETIRKWTCGETRPRHNTMVKLAQYLQVDDSWLAFGHESTAPQAGGASTRDIFTDGAVTLLAGLIQCGGGSVELAERESGADLIAVIRGAQYSFRVVVGHPEDDNLVFDVPADVNTDTTVVLGVILKEGLTIEVFEIEGEHYDQAEKRGHVKRVVASESVLRRIESFAKRI